MIAKMKPEYSTATAPIPQEVFQAHKIQDLDEVLELRNQTIERLIRLNEELDREVNRLRISKKILHDQLTRQTHT